MSSDDPTTKLPEDEQGYVTKPGVTAILERIAALDQKLSTRLDQIDDHIAILSKKLDILNRELLEVKAEQERHGDRIGSLERKPS